MSRLEDFMSPGRLELPETPDPSGCAVCSGAQRSSIVCARCHTEVAPQHLLREIEVVSVGSSYFVEPGYAWPSAVPGVGAPAPVGGYTRTSSGWQRTAIMGDGSRLIALPGVEAPNKTKDTCVHCMLVDVMELTAKQERRRAQARHTVQRFLRKMQEAGNPGIETIYKYTKHRLVSGSKRVVAFKGWTVNWKTKLHVETTRHKMLATDGSWHLSDGYTELEPKYYDSLDIADHEWVDVAEALEAIAARHGVQVVPAPFPPRLPAPRTRKPRD